MPVIVGFVLCLPLICVPPFIAWALYSVTMSKFYRANGISTDFAKAQSDLHIFNACEAAVLRFRETNNEESADKRQEQLQDLAEMLLFTEQHFSKKNYYGSNDMPDIMVILMDKFHEFAVCIKNDLEISESLKHAEESTDQWRKLQVIRQDLREKQDEIAYEVRILGGQVIEHGLGSGGQIEMEMVTLYNQTGWILFFSTAAAFGICICICFVVVRMIGRESLPSRSDDFSYSDSEPSADMRVVADRLQEVVNLLRK